MAAFWPHAESMDWWDGPERFKRINRCEVHRIQNEAAIRMISAIVADKKVDLGGPSLDVCPPGIYGGWDICNLVRVADAVTVVADACATPYASGTFGAAVTFHSIEHVPDPRDFLRECSRILRPGGLLYVVCPHKEHVHHDMLDMGQGSRCYSEWSPDELLTLFRQTLPTFDVLSFNTRLNHYDFEIFARKTVSA
jgi:SAM-dependent methyltransferase